MSHGGIDEIEKACDITQKEEERNLKPYMIA
jgi:hypothetical protein